MAVGHLSVMAAPQQERSRVRRVGAACMTTASTPAGPKFVLLARFRVVRCGHAVMALTICAAMFACMRTAWQDAECLLSGALVHQLSSVCLTALI